VSDAFANDPVAEQYERWSYPQLGADLSGLSLKSPHNHFKDLKELYWAYWPCAPERADLDILVAGCGTMAAAGYAYLFPQARVVGIDVSAASLAHEAHLKEKHALGNLTLHQCRIEDVSSLGNDFDFINVHGVLHHLADPAAGLRALGGVLRDEGVIAIMNYAPHGRAGVYILQEFFRLLGLKQDADGVRIVKDTLRAVGPTHPIHLHFHRPIDANSDASLVDTFLHARDRAYSVTQCLALVNEAGLTFQGWDENSLYYPDGRIPSDHPLLAPMNRLPDAALWQAMELLIGTLHLHFFHACRRDRPQGHYRVRFEGSDFLDYIPVPRVAEWTPPDASGGRPATIARPPFPPVPLNNWQALLFSQIDGRRTIRACLEKTGRGVVAADLVEFARNFFRSLWRVGYMVFRMPPQKVQS
jgi:SAM-dependent methyltransferase